MGLALELEFEGRRLFEWKQFGISHMDLSHGPYNGFWIHYFSPSRSLQIGDEQEGHPLIFEEIWTISDALPL
ncbi:hypothetical protein PanWU01x14_368540 [Parasponia andersonii]|uniref:Uncharacterized protein n=1 Tax=Parasponia andersonii TaxID=3476 RepID=A0A2P5A502_PARAD|nr:hypothetical protein PanWU01x14_368540 [Parasponia andersonii]